MYLQNLILVQFKNYTQSNFSFHSKLNCLIGKNGVGKTNLLDAIYYLCFCKSYFNAIDSQNITHNEHFFRICGTWQLGHQNIEIVCKYGTESKKKEILNNNLPYSKFSEHIGLLPLVIIAPDDVYLVKEGSDVRRKLMDTTLSQLDSVYLQTLIKYEKILLQRNSVLKQSTYYNQNPNYALIEAYNTQLVPLGNLLFEKRKELTNNLLPFLQQYYQILSNNAETVQCTYQSLLSESPFNEILDRNLSVDKQLQRTTQGSHRDDWKFTIDNYPLKKFGSQGQQKTYLIALKLAIYSFIAEQKNFLPLLLLDDIFDKLDEHRTAKLIELVMGKNFGQIFITDTQIQRIELLFNELDFEYKCLILEK